MKYWITKYALTTGIKVTTTREPKGGWLYDGWTTHKVGSAAFDNEAAALANAERRRAKKIAALEKQIDELRALKFEAGDVA